MNKKEMELSKGSKYLGILWLTSFAVIILLIFIQIISKHNAEYANAAKEWILGTSYPIITLILGTWISNAKSSDPSKNVDKIWFYIALGVSIFYLLILITLILSQGYYVDQNKGKTRKDIFIDTKSYLSFIHGIVTGVLGIFFVKSK